ncbi:MAG: FMN-binding protein [Candidatus Sabulitectum sp.]|nr:FMN-binding protein [Candidatus Sabulitectum sp.]
MYEKKILIALAALVIAAAATGLWFKARLNKMYSIFESEQITDIDLTAFENGEYIGEAGDFVVSVKLSVTVENHCITSIDILDQSSGKGYEAHEVLDRIIEAQSPDVDAVTGATGSSQCIMIAVRNALTP